MKLAFAFLLTFTAGPAAFWVLARQQPAKGYVLLLCGLVFALAGGAFAITGWWAPVAPQSPYPGVLVILALWFAWISALALCSLAVQVRSKHVQIQRIAFAVCAVATTLPWFGYLTAQLIGG